MGLLSWSVTHVSCKNVSLQSENFTRFLNTHPTLKPLALMSYLVKLVTMPERNLILDPFMGSGSTLVACKLAGLAAIGIEKNEEYAEIAANRLRQVVLNFESVGTPEAGQQTKNQIEPIKGE